MYGASSDGLYAGIRMQLRFPGVGWESASSRSSSLSSSGSGSSGPGSSPGVREAVGSISRSSRRRLREAVWSVQPALLPRLGPGGRWLRPASFVTFTYPLEDLPRHVADPRLHKRHLDAMWKSITRAYPGSWAVWVLEFQRNGNAHFHLLVRWGERSGTWFDIRRWVAETWSGIIADGREGDEDGEIRAKNQRVGTAVDPLITGGALARYVTKAGSKGHPAVPVGVAVAGELAKRSQKHVRIEGQGRWWGVLNRSGYRAAVSVLEVYLPPATAWKLWAAIASDWRGCFERRGLVVDAQDPEADVQHLPRWLPADRADRALLALGEPGALWGPDATVVDTKTGEELTAADLGDAASA